VYSFFKHHIAEISLVVLTFSVTSLLWIVLFTSTACRGMWSLNHEIKSEKGTMTTVIDYSDCPPVGCDGVEKKDDEVK